MTAVGRRYTSVATALWALVALSLVLPANVPALDLWRNHTLFFPLAVVCLGVGLLVLEGRRLFFPPRGPLLVEALVAVVALSIIAAALSLRGVHPPVDRALVLADLVRAAFVVVALESLRRFRDPVRRVFALLVPFLALEGLAVLFAWAPFGAATRPGDTLVGIVPRVFSGIGDPNLTALALVVGLGGALGFVLTGPRVLFRIAAGLAALVLLGALVRTVSLGGLFGLLTLLLVLAAGLGGMDLQRTARRRLLLLLGGLLFLVVGFGGRVFWIRIRSEYVRTLANPDDFGDYRVVLLVGGARMLLAHPWRGVGPGRVVALMPRYEPRVDAPPAPQTCHDFLLGLGDESGVIPLLIVGGLLVVLVYGLLRLLLPAVRGRAPPDPWGVVIGAVLAATLIQALALPAQRDPFLWLVVSLAAAHLFVRSEGRATTAPPR
jgi:O-antigen ligase